MSQVELLFESVRESWRYLLYGRLKVYARDSHLLTGLVNLR